MLVCVRPQIDEEALDMPVQKGANRHVGRVRSPRIVLGPRTCRPARPTGLRARLEHLRTWQKVLIAVIGIPALVSGAWTGTQAIASAADRWWWEVRLPNLQRTTSSFVLGTEVYQRGELAAMFADEVMGRLTIVALRHEPFQLRFPEEFGEPGIAICAWVDASMTVEPADRPPYPMDDQWSCVEEGRSMARLAVSELILSPSAHNFFGGARARRSDGRAVIDVTNLHAARGELANENLLKTYEGSLFLFLFVNTNGDDYVDYQEYEFLELRF